MRVRDSQRSRVYKAERVAFREFDKREFTTLAECRDYVNSITKTAYWRRRAYFPKGAVEVGDGRGSRRARAFSDEDRIELPRWSRKRWVILHELAHLLVWDDGKWAAHGREYTRVYLGLVERFLGTDQADKLSRAFREHNVRVALAEPEWVRVAA